MATDVDQLVRAYITAVGDGRLEELDAYLRSDVVFDGAGVANRLEGAPAYVGALRRLSPIIKRNEIKRVFVDGAEACVLYDFVTDTPAGAVASVEWLRIEDGKIASIWLLFDKARWPEVLAHLGRASSSGS